MPIPLTPGWTGFTAYILKTTLTMINHTNLIIPCGAVVEVSPTERIDLQVFNMPPKPRTTKRKRSNLVTKSRLNNELQGVRFNIPDSPTNVSAAPWYPLVLANTATSNSKAGLSSTYSSKSLFAALKGQLHLEPPADSGFIARVQSVKIWMNQKGTSERSFDSLNAGIVFYGMVQNATATSDPIVPVRAEFEEMASGVHPVKIGYRWPAMDRRTPIYSWNDSELNIFEYAVNVPSVPIFIHLHILWRSGQQANLQMGVGTSSSFLESFRRRCRVDDDDEDSDSLSLV